MDSYPFLRPDGAETGAWGCGACHRAHAQTNRNSLPQSEANHASAERCCVPRHCGVCGKTTERDVFGNYAYVHPECLPPLPAPHASMASPWARLLHRRLSDLSQDGYGGGWVLDNEFALWRMLQGGDPRHGWYVVTPEDLDELRVLSEQAGGWIWTGDDDRPRLVSFERWRELAARADGP